VGTDRRVTEVWVGSVDDPLDDLFGRVTFWVTVGSVDVCVGWVPVRGA
jgi:hypothetical protein